MDKSNIIGEDEKYNQVLKQAYTKIKDLKDQIKQLKGNIKPNQKSKFEDGVKQSKPNSGSLINCQRSYQLNMPQMIFEGVSEDWLFKELGDMHWRMGLI